MFVRVTSFRYDTAREADVLRHVEQDLSSVIRGMTGFRQMTVNLDREAGRGVVISHWDDREHAQALREAVGPALLQRSADASVQLDSSQVFEQVLQI